MIAGRDSSFHRPSVAQLQQAKAAGVRNWGGYLTTKPNVGIAAPWDQASFERVRSVLGSTPLAYCSGWDDPVACKQKAAAWNVKPCLDDEAGIRAGLEAGLTHQEYQTRLQVRGQRRVDGSWVQPWLDASGAGLYGNPPVFNGRRAPFFVLAAYPGGNPGRTWPSGHPGVPCGWQWQGTHDEFGGGVDSTWLDDWFSEGAAEDMTGEQDALLRNIFNFLRYGADSVAGESYTKWGGHIESIPEIAAGVGRIEQQVGKLSTPTVDVQALSPLLVAALGPPLVAALVPHVPDPELVAKDVLAGLGKALGPRPPG